jgi:quinol monooxygenase YgiN
MDRRTFMIASAAVTGASAAAAAASAADDVAGANAKGPRTFVLIEIKAAAGKEDLTRKTFVEVIKTSHKPGILSAQIFEDAAKPGVFYSLQEWEDEAAFRKHMSDNTQGLEESKAAMMDGLPKLTILKFLS